MYTIPTPILFLKEFKDIPNAFLGLLGQPAVYYSDTEDYSLNSFVESLVGFNIFQVAGILGLSFLASIVMVTILLPNIYFRVMLYTDKTVEGDALQTDTLPLKHIENFRYAKASET